LKPPREIAVTPVSTNSRPVALLSAQVTHLSPGTDEKSWERLYLFCFKEPYEPKKFTQLFGVSIHISNVIWGILWRSIPPPEFLKFEPKHLLWTLYHLKNNGAADFNVFGVCYKTFRLWTWKVIELLYAFVNDVSLECNSLVVV